MRLYFKWSLEKVKNSSGSEKKSSGLNVDGLEADLNIVGLDAPSLNSEFNKEVKLDEKESFNNKPTIEIAKSTSSMEIPKESWDGFRSIDTIDIEKEFFGIKLTDGIYDEDNMKYLKTYDIKKAQRSNIGHVLHFADHMSTLIERDEASKLF